MSEAERRKKETDAAREILRQASYLRRGTPERTLIENCASEVLRYWSDDEQTEGREGSVSE